MKCPFQNFSKRSGPLIVFESVEVIDPVKAHDGCQQEDLGSPLVMETTEPHSNVGNYVDGRENSHDGSDNDIS